MSQWSRNITPDKTGIKLLLAVLTMTAALCACQTSKSVPPVLSVTQIADGVFLHQGHIALNNRENMADIANIGFIVGNSSVAVIDAGGSRTVARKLLNTIRKHTKLPVAWLILTHAHPDHALGASVFSEAGARVIGHHRLGAALANRFETDLRDLNETTGQTVEEHLRPVIPDLVVRSTTRIDLGGRMLVIQAHPTAHTDHDLSVHDPSTETLWLSDLLFIKHTPSLEGSLIGWISVLESLQQLQNVSTVIPGHGPASRFWPRAADAQLHYLNDLARQTRSAIADGMTISQASQNIGYKHAHDWILFEHFHPRNIIIAYTELEWEQIPPKTGALTSP